jgi:hypothetical protein
MVAGEANDLYVSDTYAWSATSSAPGAKDELAVTPRMMEIIIKFLKL